MRRPRILAHQGGAAQWPGNSRRAFAEIVRRPVDGVELDVHVAADGELVVMHDATCDLPDGRRVPVATVTSAELARRSGPDGAGQTLREILPVLAPARFDIQIDLKTDAYAQSYPDLLPRLAALVIEAGLEERVVISSFLLDALREARQLLPGVRLRAGIMPLVTEQLGGAFSAMRAYADVGVSILDVNLHVLDARLIDAVMAHEMEVGVGTVNGAIGLEQWLRCRVDRIMTDEPDLALALRAKLATVL